MTWNEPTASDNSGVVSLASRTHAPGAFFAVGNTDVTYRFVDGSGNSASCTFTISVEEGKIAVSTLNEFDGISTLYPNICNVINTN